jgi:hypothetical protein
MIGAHVNLRHSIFLLAAVLTTTGCTFKSPDGRNLNLRQYDSVNIDSVDLRPTVKVAELAPLVAGYTAVAVLENDKWMLASDFDLDAFAAFIEEYSTTSHTVDGKPVKPIKSEEQFQKEHAKLFARWRSKLARPKGDRPITIKIRVTELRFPEDIEKIVVGTNPRLLCTVDAYDGDTLLGSAEMEAISGLPGVPFHPGGMVQRSAFMLLFEEYQRESILKLTDEMGREIVDALSRAQ